MNAQQLKNAIQQMAMNGEARAMKQQLQELKKQLEDKI